jgi:hypothetical protein
MSDVFSRKRYLRKEIKFIIFTVNIFRSNDPKTQMPAALGSTYGNEEY